MTKIKIEITGSQHERPRGNPPPAEYPGHELFAKLGEQPAETLRALGLCIWDGKPDHDGNVLWGTRDPPQRTFAAVRPLNRHLCRGFGTFQAIRDHGGDFQ